MQENTPHRAVQQDSIDAHVNTTAKCSDSIAINYFKQ